MPIVRLTEPTISKLRPQPGQLRTDYFDERTPALCLRVGPRRRTWILHARILREGQWKLTRLTIGHHPAISLSEARRQAARIRDQIELGVDRVAAARSTRRATEDASQLTFSIACERFLKDYASRPRPPADRTLKETARLLRAKDLAGLASRPLDGITRADIRAAVTGIVARGAPVAGNRTLAALGTLFQWATDNELVRIDPTTGIRPPAREQSRSRVLTREEIAQLWAITEDGHIFSDLVRLLLLSGQRKGEIAAARYSDLTEIQGIPCLAIPAEHAKNRRHHLVPLAPAALDIIDRRRRFTNVNNFIFENTKGQPFSAWSTKPRLDARAQLAPWTLHDLRRTLVTVMNEQLKIQPHIVESVVNHMSGRAGVAGVYNRALYLEERRAALEAYARWVLEAPSV